MSYVSHTSHAHDERSSLSVPPLDSLAEGRLLAAMERPGCPLCRAVWQAESQTLNWYVNDGAVDEPTYHRVRRSLGFCGRHTVALALIESDKWAWGHLGFAMLHEDTLRARVAPLVMDGRHYHAGRLDAFRLALALRRTGACPACEDRQSVEREQVTAFASSLCLSAEFRRSYAHGASLCLPHRAAVMAEIRRLEADGVTGGSIELLVASSHTPEDERLPELARRLYGGNPYFWGLGSDRLRWEDASADARCDVCVSVSGEVERQAAELFSQPVAPTLCEWHGWIMASAPQPESDQGDWQSPWQDTRSAYSTQRDALCPLCALTRRLEDEQLRAAPMETGEEMYCLPHIRRALSLTARGALPASATIRTAQRLAGYANEVGKRLRGYIAHCSEDQQEAITAAERASWREAARWFGGIEADATLAALQLAGASRSHTQTPG